MKNGRRRTSKKNQKGGAFWDFLSGKKDITAEKIKIQAEISTLEKQLDKKKDDLAKLESAPAAAVAPVPAAAAAPAVAPAPQDSILPEYTRPAGAVGGGGKSRRRQRKSRK
jgi:hypothetical protein